MTTIAYNHKEKEIAVDSRVTKGRFIVSDEHNKVRKKDGVIFILCGSECDIEKLVNEWPELSGDVDCYGYLIIDRQVKFITPEDGKIIIENCNYSDTAGSGEDFAMTAMDLGCTAKQAVKMAMKRDSGTGGKIRVIKV